MSDLRQAAQQALDYIEQVDYGPYDNQPVKQALRAALDAQEEHDTDCHTQGICQRSGYSIGGQQEWPTGCPECGMDSGCDCDSGTWRMEEQEVAQQEPVVFRLTKTGALLEWEPTGSAFALPDGKHSLYTTPPARKPLTEDEIERLIQTYSGYCRDDFASVARAIERAHGIKGGNDE